MSVVVEVELLDGSDSERVTVTLPCVPRVGEWLYRGDDVHLVDGVGWYLTPEPGGPVAYVSAT